MEPNQPPKNPSLKDLVQTPGAPVSPTNPQPTAPLPAPLPAELTAPAPRGRSKAIAAVVGIFAVLIAVVLAVVMLAGSRNDVNQTAGVLIAYQHPSYGFSLSYPETWGQPVDEGNVVAFGDPAAGPSARVSVTDLFPNYGAASAQEKDELFVSLAKGFTDPAATLNVGEAQFKPTANASLAVPGAQHAIKITLSGGDNQPGGAGTAIMALSPTGRLFSLSLTGAQTQLDSARQTYDEMLASFTIESLPTEAQE